MRRLIATVTLVLVVVASAPIAKAGVIPVGVQNDVSYNTVINDWGWKVIYSDTYATTDVDIDDLFVGAGEYVMLAAKRADIDSFDILAAATLAEVRTSTYLHQTHLANGAQWYYNGYSMGFAGEGDLIYQDSADTWEYTIHQHLPWESDRLSWHTGHDQTYTVPTVLESGWRSGVNVDLDSSEDWERFVLTYAPDAVPEPTTLAIWSALGGLGMIAARRRRRNA